MMKKILKKILFWQKLSGHQQYRLLEMIPGTITWSVFIILFILSFILPVSVVYFIIAYAFLWLVRVGYFVVYLFIAWHRFRQEVKINWLSAIKHLNISPTTLKSLTGSEIPENFSWNELYHAILLPTYKEPSEVLDHTISGLKQSNYPKDKMIVMLGGEERAGEKFNQRLYKLKEKYQHTFYKFIVTIHPQDIPGEIIGKGSNVYHMGHVFQKFVDNELQVPYEKIIISSFDCDTVVHSQYFARLTYAYLTNPQPTKSSYQPLALYNNNIWESPSFTRVVANSTTFWLMTELSRPEQFMTFSSHSMPFKALVDVGFWEKDIITEDSRIFLQCFLKYDGNYSLVPMYIPVNMDTVAVKSFWRTVKNQYKQMQRWAWSVEHQPYLIKKFSQNKNIPKWVKLRYIWKLMEGQFSWATAPLLLAIFSRLPLAVASAQHHTFVLIQNAPFVLERILGAAMVGMVLSAIFNILLLPGPPPKNPIVKYFVMVIQWFLLPVTLIVFGSIPAIDAQTRLMLGKYLGFWNTEKTRISN